MTGSEGFVTAVHLWLDLATGEYVIASAGHPPAVHYDAGSGSWRIGKAHGIVLGVVADTRSVPEHGLLRPGDALMLYTDGLVEAPGRHMLSRHRGPARRGGPDAPPRASRRARPLWCRRCRTTPPAPTIAPWS